MCLDVLKVGMIVRNYGCDQKIPDRQHKFQKQARNASSSETFENHYYRNCVSPLNREDDGKTNYALTVKDVPVDGFASITVYNAKGFMEKNELGINSLNNLTAKPNKDGGATVHFGGCEDGRINCIPVTDGWNYIVRMYQPKEAVIDGSWKFPDPTPVK